MDDLDLGATIRGFSPGQKVFKRYTLKKILGRGGMGVVWLARDEELEREVALKFLPEVIMGDRGALEELKRETRRNLELTHPHIVRIYDFVQDERTAAISMEYVAGDTLSNLRVDEPGQHFEVAALRRWVGQLGEALVYAHEKGKVVHRDLKPANLMIDAAGDLKVTDFGIARSLSDSVSRVSMQAGSSGTPVYMSPQQMMGEKASVSDDIYALGATLYELLTGKPPFYSGNIILQVQNKVPPGMAERRAELETTGEAIPASWEETVAACLAKQPDDRPRSVREVVERLEGGKPASVEPAEGRATSPRAPGLDSGAPGGENATRRLGDKPPYLKVVLGFMAAVAVLASAGYYFGLHVPEQKRIAEEKAAEARRIAEEQRVAEEQRRAEEAEKVRLAALRVPVTLETTPTGAEIFVNGQSKGVLEQTLPLPLGTHTVRAVLAGHDDYETSIVVEEHGQMVWKFPLVRSMGLVRLTGRPEGAPYWFFPVDEQNRRLQETPVAGGNLPHDGFKLPVGRYEVLVQARGAPEIAHRELITVQQGETVAVDADVRGGTLKLDSTPAGATVVINGKEAGQTPITRLNAYPRGQKLSVELRLAGHEPAQREITINDDYGKPTVWSPALAMMRPPDLKVDFRNAPRNFKIRVNMKSTGTGQTTTGGKTTTDSPTNLEISDNYLYTMTAVNEAGHWQQARVVTAPEGTNGKLLRPGTVTQFDRVGAAWQASFVQGGFNFEGAGADIFIQVNPAMSLDQDTLPAGPAKAGRAWAVPLRAVGMMPFGYRLVNAAGPVRGRIVAVGEDGAGWVDLEYTFDLSGNFDPPPSARTEGFEYQGTVAYAGSMTMRLFPAEGYVSRARLQYRSKVDLVVTSPALSGMVSLLGQGQAAASTPIRTVSTTDNVMEYETEPVAQDAAAQAVSVAPDVKMRDVIIFREKEGLLNPASPLPFSLALGGRDVGALKNGHFIRVRLAPGEHHIDAIGVRHPITVAPQGETYLQFKVDVENIGMFAKGWPRYIPHLIPVTPEQGRAAVAKLKEI